MQQHPTEALPAYALKCLDVEEFEQTRQHLVECADCRAEVRQLEQTLAELSHAVPLIAPPASVKSRLLSTLRPRRSYAWFDQLVNRWPRLVPAVGLAALVSAILLGALNVAFMHEGRRLHGRDLSGLQLAQFLGTAAMPDARGVLLVTGNATQGILIATAMKPLKQSEQYQLWLIKDGQRTNGGVFSVTSAGDARLIVSAEAPLDTYDAFGVTIEPFGGSPGPTGPKVLGGTMHL